MILFIGFLFSGVLASVLGTMLGGNIGFLADPASFVFILIPVIFFLCVTGNGKVICRYIKKSFGKKPQYSEAELSHIAAAAAGSAKVTIAAGFFIFILGMINLLFSFPYDNPDAINLLGINLSAGLISLLYAVAIAFFVFFPLRAWAEHKLIDTK